MYQLLISDSINLVYEEETVMKKHYVSCMAGVLLLTGVLLTGCGQKPTENNPSVFLEQSGADLIPDSSVEESDIENSSLSGSSVGAEEGNSEESSETALPYTVLETRDNGDSEINENRASNIIQITEVKNGEIKGKRIKVVPPSDGNTTAVYEIREWNSEYEEQSYQLKDDCEVWIWDKTSVYNRISVEDLHKYLDEQTDTLAVFDIYKNEDGNIFRMTQISMPFSKLFRKWDENTEEPNSAAVSYTVLETKTEKEMEYRTEVRILKTENGTIDLQEIVSIPVYEEGIGMSWDYLEWDIFSCPLSEDCEIWYLGTDGYTYNRVSAEEFSLVLDTPDMKYQGNYDSNWDIHIVNGIVVKIIEQYTP